MSHRGFVCLAVVLLTLIQWQGLRVLLGASLSHRENRTPNVAVQSGADDEQATAAGSLCGQATARYR